MRRLEPSCLCLPSSSFFFFNDTATTEIYTLSLHDALPIYPPPAPRRAPGRGARARATPARGSSAKRYRDRKSTRLNSSHTVISYAVFCLKKKKKDPTAKEVAKADSGHHADDVFVDSARQDK